LGCRLVEELGLDDSVDTLGRWMAHYLADLITNADSATGEDKAAVQKNCFDAILALWKYRAELPNGKRPFEELEPVIRALETLDPDDDTPRYFRAARQSTNDRKEKAEAEAWLKMVDGLDYSAKVLIGYCLAEAARASIDKSQEWVKLAEAAGADDGVSEVVVRFVSSAADLDNKPDPDTEARRKLEDRLRRLEGFTKLAEGLAVEWRQRLQAHSPKRRPANRGQAVPSVSRSVPKRT
jgi:hypothetical protein